MEVNLADYNSSLESLVSALLILMPTFRHSELFILVQILTIHKRSIVSAFSVDESKLSAFYDSMYPGRTNLLKSHWKWLYRAKKLSNAIPLVIEDEGKVIAHAGMIPFEIIVEGKIRTACWYVDFSVLPEYQRQGIGIKMTEEWMNFGDLHVTFCNHKSLGIFKKFGWSEGEEAISHLLPLLPGNNRNWVKSMPGSMRAITNIVSDRLLYPYRKHSYPLTSCSVQKLDKGKLVDFYSKNSEPGTIKNPEYFDWRILSAPDKDSYKIFQASGCKAKGLIKLKSDNNISVLSLSGSDMSEKGRLVGSIARWGLHHGCYNLYLLTTDNQLSSSLTSKFGGYISRPTFAYHSKDKRLEEAFSVQPKFWERIDSDFDLI